MTQTQHTALAETIQQLALAEAIQQLTTYQRQLDEHGIEVGVSRQALDEVLQAVAAAPELLEALRAAEELHQVGMLNATVELVDRVVTLRRAAIAKATGAS